MKTRVECTDKKEAVVGHVPEPLAPILGPMLKDETVHSIVAKITGEKRGAPEGLWVQGGGIELTSLEVLCLWTEVYGSKPRVKSELRKEHFLTAIIWHT